MADLASTLRIEADASGVETGVASAKRSLSTLGSAAAQAGQAGGDGLARIGAGADASSKKVEAATKNTIASIQRQIAAFEAGGTSSRQYQESLAKLRGVDVNALKPYLDQLDAAKLKAQQAGRANEQLGQSFSGLGNMAGSASSMLASLGVSLSVAGVAAFVKRITDGVDALNDLKDATGASIENISALEDVAARTGASFDTVSTALIKLNQALNTAKAGSDAELAIKAIGLSVQDLKALDPAEAFRQVAIALSRFADDGNKARLTQELFGKSLKEVAPLLKDLAEKGQLNATVTTAQAEAAEQLNKELFNLKKTATDLARTLVDSLTPAITQVLKDFRTFNEKAGLASLASEVIAADKAVRALQDRKGGLFNFAGNLDAELAKAEERLKKAKAAFNALDINNPANESAAEVARLARRASVGALPDTAAAKAAAAAAKKALEEQNKELAEQAKLLAELSGLSGSFADDWDRLNRIYAAGKLTTEQLVQAQADLLAKQPAMKAGTEAAAKAMREQEKAAEDLARIMAEYVKANEAGVAAAVQAAVAAEAELANWGLLKSAVQELTLAHLKQSRELAALAGEDVSNIDRRIDAQRRLIAATRGLELNEANKKAAQEAEKDWLEMWRSVDQTAHDVFVNVFEDGSSAFKKLGQTLKAAVIDLLYQLTLKKWIISIGASITGGAANVASAATGSSALGTAGNLAGLFTGGTSVGNFAGTALANVTGTGLDGLLATNAAFGTASGGMSTLLAGLTAAAPYLALAAGIYALAKQLDKSGTPHSGGGALYTAGGGLQTQGLANGWSGGGAYLTDFGGYKVTADATQMASGIVQSVVGMLDSTATTFGQQAGYAAATAFADDSSTDGAWGAFVIKLGDQMVTEWAQWANGPGGAVFSDGSAGSAEYLAKISGDVRTALEGIGLPAWAKSMLDQLGAAPTLEQLGATVSTINTTQGALVQMGDKLTGFAALSDTAVASLLNAAGGIGNLAANASTYYDNFYTEAEKQAVVWKSLSDGFAAVSVTLPKTREEFRATVEALQAATADNPYAANALAKVWEMSGDFLAVVPETQALVTVVDELGNVTETVADQVGRSAQDIANSMQSLRDAGNDLLVELLAAQGDAAGAQTLRRALDTTGLTEAEVALYDYNQTLREQIDAVNAATEASNQAIAAAQARAEAILSERGNLQGALLQALGDTAALRQRELAALDPSNRALQQSIYNISDVQGAITALAQQAATAASTVASLEGSIAGWAATAARAGELLNAISVAGGGTDNTEANLWANIATGTLEQQMATVQTLLGSVTQSIAADTAAAQQAMTAGAQAAQQAIEAANAAQIQGANAQLAAAEKMLDLGKQLRDYVQGLRIGNLSALTPAEKLALAASAYNTTLGKAKAGDATAMSALQGNASAYLEQARAFDPAAYNSIFANVTGTLDSFGSTLMTDGQRQAATASAQLSQLQTISAYVGAQTESAAMGNVISSDNAAKLATLNELVAGIQAQAVIAQAADQAKLVEAQARADAIATEQAAAQALLITVQTSARDTLATLPGVMTQNNTALIAEIQALNARIVTLENAIVSVGMMQANTAITVGTSTAQTIATAVSTAVHTAAAAPEVV